MSLDDSQQGKPAGPSGEREAAAQHPEARASGPVPEITDPRLFRALSHPVRIALVEELTLHGPMTATEVGERIGESPTTCSFHLRQLAKYGFVEEAGGGKGRARPWRPTAIRHSFGNTPDEPAPQASADVP